MLNLNVWCHNLLVLLHRHRGRRKARGSIAGGAGGVGSGAGGGGSGSGGAARAQLLPVVRHSASLGDLPRGAAAAAASSAPAAAASDDGKGAGGGAAADFGTTAAFADAPAPACSADHAPLPWLAATALVIACSGVAATAAPFFSTLGAALFAHVGRRGISP